MRNFFLTILCCYCFPLIVQAQDGILLKGKIGIYPIVMELSIYEDTSAYARYFYENQKKDIELKGSVEKDSSITIICYNNYDEQFDRRSEKFTLRKVNNHYKGIWNTTKKTLPVDLIPFSVDELKHSFARYTTIQSLKKESPLDYVRTSTLQFIKDSSTKRDNYFLDWYHEKFSKMPFLRIRKQIMTDALKRVNDYLEEAHLIQSNSALSCTSQIEHGEYNQTIDYIFIKNNLFSIDVANGYYCGGAHPDFNFTGLNFDLAKGSEIKLDDLLHFSKPPKENSDEWRTYRDSIFAPKIVAIFKKLYPKEMQKPKNEDDCDYTNSEVWDFPNWYFTKKGIYLGAYFYRSMRACDEPEWSIIPYSVVKKYLNPSLKIELPD